MAMAFVVALSFASMASAYTKGCERGSVGSDRMFGSSRADALCGERGNDRIVGRGGNDKLVGGSDNDSIAGENGADTIKGGPGRDVLKSGGGNDTVRAGLFNQENDRARDFVHCGSGTDTAYVTGADVVSPTCEILR